jgi:hypothetical protein
VWLWVSGCGFVNSSVTQGYILLDPGLNRISPHDDSWLINISTYVIFGLMFTGGLSLLKSGPLSFPADSSYFGNPCAPFLPSPTSNCNIWSFHSNAASPPVVMKKVLLRKSNIVVPKGC